MPVTNRTHHPIHAAPMIVCAVATALIVGTGAAAQPPEPDEPEVEIRTLAPIALSDIGTRVTADGALLDQVDILLSRAPVLDQIENDLLEQERTIAERLVSLRPSLAASSSRQAISEIEEEWLEVDAVTESWEPESRNRTSVMEQQLVVLETRLETWRLTVQAAQTSDAPEELASLASDTLEQVQTATDALRAMRDRALALQGRIGVARASVRQALEMIGAEESTLLDNLTRRERPPLWSEAVTDVSGRVLVDRARSELSTWRNNVGSVIYTERDRVAFQLVLLLVGGLVLRRARTVARGWAETEPRLRAAMSVFERPFALSALATLLTTPWLYASTPPAVDDAIGLLLVIPVLRLVLPLLDHHYHLPLYLLGLLYLVDRLRDLLEGVPLVARVVFVVEMLIAISIGVWMIRSESLRGADASDTARTWHDRIVWGLYAAVILLAVALASAVGGFVRLSVLLGYGVLNSAYLALLLTALVRGVDAVLALALRSRFAQASHVIHQRTPTLRRALARGAAFGLVAWWGFATLDFFALLDPTLRSLGAVVYAEIQVGAIVLSLADVVTFIVTILAAIFAARLITCVLEEDVFARLSLGRGVGFAISSVIRYGVIAIGFLLAVGAMGIGMDRIAILVGAFGVGLGFGLQNVVNNFVSGMILIFERPVQIGDSIEVGPVVGRITRIGIRSSTVRSFDGADITVPNGTLLSDALTNWTMTDRSRRIEIPVGVAYGTSPQTVLTMLKAVLDEQRELLSQPAPQVLFTGFGESSLDFILRAWVADNDEWVRIRSDVGVAVHRVLTEHDIEIPFPQRDVHVRALPSNAAPGADGNA